MYSSYVILSFLITILERYYFISVRAFPQISPRKKGPAALSVEKYN